MITHAAIVFHTGDHEENPMIITGRSYQECYDAAEKLGVVYNKEKVVEGFLCDDYEFLDKYTAKPVAIVSGQLKRDIESRDITPEDIKFSR